MVTRNAGGVVGIILIVGNCFLSSGALEEIVTVGSVIGAVFPSGARSGIKEMLT